MATPPVILLPPSEGKAASGTGPNVNISELSFPQLAGERNAVLAAIAKAMKGKEESRSKLLGVKGAALAKSTAANLLVMTSPTMPAIDRYTGVLYDALDVASLSLRDRKRLQKQVVIFSGLWGLVRPEDMIPDYKLKMGATLPAIGKVSTSWRTPITSVLASTVDGAVVWNLLPKEHDSAWEPTAKSANHSAIPSSVFSVKFLDETSPVKGERKFTTVNHWNKLLKGALVRFILETGADDPKALATFRHPEGYKYDRTLTLDTPSGTVLSMVRAAP
ncbi:MAG: peroxide stress protein YaaA [Acidimicrobiales bacterium]